MVCILDRSGSRLEDGWGGACYDARCGHSTLPVGWGHLALTASNRSERELSPHAGEGPASLRGSPGVLGNFSFSLGSFFDAKLPFLLHVLQVSSCT